MIYWALWKTSHFSLQFKTSSESHALFEARRNSKYILVKIHRVMLKCGVIYCRNTENKSLWVRVQSTSVSNFICIAWYIEFTVRMWYYVQKLMHYHFFVVLNAVIYRFRSFENCPPFTNWTSNRHRGWKLLKYCATFVYTFWQKSWKMGDNSLWLNKVFLLM